MMINIYRYWTVNSRDVQQQNSRKLSANNLPTFTVKMRCRPYVQPHYPRLSRINCKKNICFFFVRINRSTSPLSFESILFSFTSNKKKKKKHSIFNRIIHFVDIIQFGGSCRVAIVQWQIEPLISHHLWFIRNVTYTSSKKYGRIVFSTFHNGIIISIASISQCKIQFSDAIWHFRIDIVQTFMEFFVTITMQNSEIVIICQIVFGFAGRYVITVIMVTTTHINFHLTAQIIIIGCCIAGTTPFRTC